MSEYGLFFRLNEDLICLPAIGRLVAGSFTQARQITGASREAFCGRPEFRTTKGFMELVPRSDRRHQFGRRIKVQFMRLFVRVVHAERGRRAVESATLQHTHTRGREFVG